MPPFGGDPERSVSLLSLEKGRLRGLILSYPEISLGIMRGLSLVVRECHQREKANT